MGFVYNENEESDPARRRFLGSWTNHVEAEEDAGSPPEGEDAGSPSEADEVNKQAQMLCRCDTYPTY